MISFRYHIVTLVSVFLALAIGIALGGGPLKGGVDNSLVQELAARKKFEHRQRGQIAGLRAAAASSHRYAVKTAPKVLAGTLSGTTVAVAALPGASNTIVDSLSARVRTSGGRVVGTYRFGTKLADSGNKDLIDQLGTQLQSDAPDVDVPGDVSTYERFGLLVGRAIGVQSARSAPYDQTSTSLVSGFSTAGLFSAIGTPKRRADVILVLTSGGSGDDQAAASETQSEVVDALASSARTVLVAGPAGGARKGGLIRTIRDDSALSNRISTVDTAASGTGGVITMLAVAKDLAQGTGQYGAVDAADGPVPDLTTR